MSLARPVAGQPDIWDLGSRSKCWQSAQCCTAQNKMLMPQHESNFCAATVGFVYALELNAQSQAGACAACSDLKPTFTGAQNKPLNPAVQLASPGLRSDAHPASTAPPAGILGPTYTLKPSVILDPSFTEMCHMPIAHKILADHPVASCWGCMSVLECSQACLLTP